ncbi:DUF3052 domain-containing protein [Pedobacter sp. N23S346]|uniref:DUF3052 domain-containing protein n=1 Tax=Pedobacter sp. N23S346 TaxID=3402750 RepID=UPI003ACAE4C8
MKTSGYSGTPLAKKLGIKEGFKIRLIGQPYYYFGLFEDMPANVHLLDDKEPKKNLIHYFTKSADDLRRDIPLLKNEIFPNGIIWISWPKKASKVMTDMTEDVVRGLALHNGLVDIKVCAIDEIWSGLKLVIPLKDRKPLVNIPS